MKDSIFILMFNNNTGYCRNHNNWCVSTIYYEFPTVEEILDHSCLESSDPNDVEMANKVQNINIKAIYVKDNELAFACITESINKKSVSDSNNIISAIFDYLADVFYGFRETYLPKQSKETMWIARDTSGYLYLYEMRPVLSKSKDEYISNGKYMVLNFKLFPEITFENSPKEVELSVKLFD